MVSPDSQTQTVPPPQPPPAPPATGTMAPPPPEPPGRRPRGAKAGVALIIIGMVLLFGQFLPGISWWQLWPLIIVAAGIIQMVTPGQEGWNIHRVFEGLVTIAIGGVFLAIVTGFVTWHVWGVLFALWPVLLVSIGFDLLGKALNMSWLKVVGSVVVLAAIAYAIWASAGGITPGWRFAPTAGDTVKLSEPVSGAERASLRMDAGVASVHLEGGDQLFEGTATSPFGRPQLDVTRTVRTADLELTLGDRQGVVMWPSEAGAEVDARLSSEVLWDLRLQTGVASLDADLEDVRVRKLLLVPGVTDVKVRMGEVPQEVDEAQLEVRAGVSTVRIELPSDAAVRIESASGLTGQDIDDSYERVNGGWQSDDYAQAERDHRPRWLVVLKSGVGSVKVDTY